MSTYRQALPQLGDRLFITDGGLETSLIFHEGIDLPEFAAFVLLKDQQGRDALENYYRSYARIAKQAGLGFILESPTWRSSPDWGQKIGYTKAELHDLNTAAITLMESIRDEFESADQPYVISGCIGPRGDGYRADNRMTATEARDYHADQIGSFALSTADCVTAVTMNYVEEGSGIALAARDQGIPAVISFTVETDGRLPSGETLDEAIALVDEVSGGYPAYYMVNCAHPSHFESSLAEMEHIDRIRGIRANASRCSHAELDEAEKLDDGDPEEFGLDYRRLLNHFPNINVVGGCCGTDQRHIEQISLRLIGRDAA
ncbi:homocysteine S-methyltransferase family protein [Marinobacter arenosus]|uniref:homocysteine S-methyltransferase family protein n=1 Tax=Marinobacter arenosus TaxID=2856822 RepID=UPI001C4DD00C|nr:homocysteine S-methyltransferase family protein [Marinobacter arenosus]MBW0147178.1 homocysteine S-methyltransferase family protein [Marinobacter arenosus]